MSVNIARESVALSRPLLLLSVAALLSLAPGALAEPEVKMAHGIVRCSAGATPVAVSTTDCASSLDRSLDSWKPSNFTQYSAVQFELRWTEALPVLAVPAQLRMSLAFAPTADARAESNGVKEAYNTYRGANPLVIRFHSTDGLSSLRTPGYQHPLDVRAVLGVRLNQPYEFAAAWFENGTIPEDYSAFHILPPAADEAYGDDPQLDSMFTPMALVPTEESSPILAWVWVSSVLVAVACAGRWVWAGTGRWSAFAVALFSRIDRDEALEHPKRSALQQLIASEPGIAYAEARARLQWRASSFDHHLHVLLRHRAVVRVREGHRVHLYPVGAPRPGAPSMTAERLLDLVRAQPGIGRADLAARLGLHEDTIGYHATWLARRGLLEKREDRRVVRYYPRSEAF